MSRLTLTQPTLKKLNHMDFFLALMGLVSDYIVKNTEIRSGRGCESGSDNPCGYNRIAIFFGHH
jgi:hypothetical protein